MTSSQTGPGPHPSAGDATLAAVALVCVQIEVWGFWVVSEQGPRPVAAGFGFGMALALAWSRTRPFAALLAVLLLHACWTLAAVPQGSLFPFLIELVAVYACALRTPGGPAAVGFVAAVATEVIFVVRTTNDFADYLFILVFVAAAFAAGLAVRSRQQKADLLFARTVRLEVEREERARQATHEERNRIAREMHDIISHGVSVMVVQAAAAEQVLDRDPRSARQALQAVQDMGRETRIELRRMLGLMRAPLVGDLAPQPDLDQLPALMEQVRRAGLEVDLHVTGTAPPLLPGVALTAYRVVQEGLTNALAHGDSSWARVELEYAEDAVVIEMVNPAQPGNGGGGHGLAGMRERLQVYGGSLDHGCDTDGQFRLSARVPYAGAVP